MTVYFGAHSQVQAFAEKFMERFPQAIRTSVQGEADLIVDYSDVSYSPEEHQIVLMLIRTDRPERQVHHGKNILGLEPYSALNTLGRFVKNLNACSV